MFRSPSRHAALLPSVTIVASVSVLGATALAAASSQHALKDRLGIACVVAVPASRSGTPDADRIAVDVRVPGTPDAALLVKLPASRRDYSSLPIAVFLVPAPAKGDPTTARLSRTTPLAADFAPRRLGINSDPALDLFVRVEYTRETLQAGVDLVAERTAAADSGERLTSQTRCRITASDANLWR